jgi:hypothetical protein
LIAHLLTDRATAKVQRDASSDEQRQIGEAVRRELERARKIEERAEALGVAVDAFQKRPR